MKWVTRDYVHLDRVACPWLIRRFIDREAVFVFVPWGEEHLRPADAIPFDIPGAELGPHDSDGTTFLKLQREIRTGRDPALDALAKIIAAGVDYVLHDYRPDRNDEPGQMAVGLLACSEGMMLIRDGDNDIIESALVIYDALYAHLRAQYLARAGGITMPDPAGKGPTLQIRLLRQLLVGDNA